MFPIIKKIETGTIVYYDLANIKKANHRAFDAFINLIGANNFNDYKLDRREKYNSNTKNQWYEFSHNIIKVPYWNKGCRYIAFRGPVENKGNHAVIKTNVIVFDENSKIYNENIALKIEKETREKWYNLFVFKKQKEAKVNDAYCRENRYKPVFIYHRDQKEIINKITCYQPIILFTQNLCDYVKTNRSKLPFAYLVKLYADLAEDIYLNLTKKGVIHCDLNNKNVVVRPNEDKPGVKIKIIDFGNVRDVGEECAHGTYMPFYYFFGSQDKRKKVTEKFDVFSLGFLIISNLSQWFSFGMTARFFTIYNVKIKPHIDTYMKTYTIGTKTLNYIHNNVKIEVDKYIDLLNLELTKKAKIKCGFLCNYLKRMTAVLEQDIPTMEAVCNEMQSWLNIDLIKQPLRIFLHKRKLPINPDSSGERSNDSNSDSDDNFRQRKRQKKY